MNPSEHDQRLIDFLHRLKRERGPAATRRRPRRDHVPTLIAVLLLGGLFGALVFLASAETVRQIAFAHHSRTVEATIVEIRHGEPVVSLRTEAGEEATVLAHGTYRHGDPVGVTVRHLVDHPEQAVLADHRWTPWWALPLAVVVLFGVHALWAPTGIRAGWAWRRARAHVQGPEPGGWTPRALVGPVVGATLLSVVAIGLAAPPFARGGVPALAAAPEGLVPVGVAAMFVVGAGTVVVRAWYHRTERVPAARPPRPFRLVSGGVFWVPALVACAVSVIVVLVSWPLDALVDWEHREEGVAEVIGVTCRSQGRGSCAEYLVLRYEADGLTYVEEVSGDFAPGGVPVEWNAEDPTRVRVIG
ncbi:hypothetical protein [Nocardiopsis lambiniae]|uniref:DUF3592 domain-containing protein n=1 Tax=Nocardiopsis lambiniae TaxID=3075539 RepID=A0ABU2MDL0_9ACTN|nr:hypothetical protein [Nocardiopsis sp. DSM 44743]MDT0330767.1 hypothetical protein [Nocardiopsis sp. DSM 44743]